MFGAEAESETIYEEGRGVLGTIIANIGNFIMMLVNNFIKFIRSFYHWMAEHPLSAILCISNFCVLLM